MKLFEMKNWNLQVAEEAWGISAFSKILKRDKSKQKEIAMKEMSFVWFFADIKSNYNYIADTEERVAEIKNDISLPEKWEYDEVMQEAVRVYIKNSQSVIEKLYLQSLKAAQDVGNYLENTDVLLAERNDKGGVITDIAKITGSLEKVPKIMGMLKAAYKEVVKEQEETENRQKGSKTMNMFEDMNNFGLDE